MPGPRCHFRVNKAKNPNPAGGCFCSPDSKLVDCKGPYIVGTHAELMNPRQPYVVIGSGCVRAMQEGVWGKPAPVAAPAVAAEVSLIDALADATTAELASALSSRLAEPKAD